MKVTILGCGASAGVPQIGGPDGRGDWGACDPRERRNRRTRSSIVIERHGQRLLVDTGPDLREQLLACGISRVDAILYTHAHADHIAGMDDVKIINRIIDRSIDIFASTATLDELHMRFDYVFRPWQGPHFFRPVVQPHVLEPGRTVETCGMTLQVFDQDHGFVRTIGFRAGQFAYCTDVAVLDETALDLLRGVDTFLVECFQRRPHNTHAHPERVAEWAARIQPRRTIITHMSYDLDWRWMQKHLPAGIEPAYDGMVLEIPDAGAK